jgi:hypothetical protein
MDWVTVILWLCIAGNLAATYVSNRAYRHWKAKGPPMTKEEHEELLLRAERHNETMQTLVANAEVVMPLRIALEELRWLIRGEDIVNLSHPVLHVIRENHALLVELGQAPGPPLSE